MTRRCKGANGVLPGTILLNGAFTEKAMENLLSGPHTVVHIASHFVFQPGDDSQSYLLLAGKDTDRFWISVLRWPIFATTRMSLSTTPICSPSRPAKPG